MKTKLKKVIEEEVDKYIKHSKLPEKWYIRTTKESNETVCDWFVSLSEDNKTFCLKNGRHWYNRYLEITPEFCRLLGYYIAGGSSGQHGINFAFNIKETEYHQDVISLLYSFFPDTLSIKLLEVPENNVGTIYSNSYVLKYLFTSLSGIGAANKFINFDLLSSEKHAIELLTGLHRGDGCITTSGSFIAVSTISRQLAFDTRHCLQKLEIMSYFSISETGGRNPLYTVMVYQTNNPKVNNLFGLNLKEVSNKRFYGDYNQGFFGKRVKKPKTCYYTEPITVYNLEVEGDNSYHLADCIVHNCDALSQALNWLASKAGNSVAIVATDKGLDSLHRIAPRKGEGTSLFKERNSREPISDFSNPSRNLIQQASVSDIRKLFN
jgi:hypothetical protein